MSRSVDAIVIGAGPNGLVAANVLADHGWDVVVLELECHGLEWCHAPDVLAHPTVDGTARLSRDVDVTASSLGLRGATELARDALVPVDRFASERFAGDGAALLFVRPR